MSLNRFGYKLNDEDTIYLDKNYPNSNVFLSKANPGEINSIFFFARDSVGFQTDTNLILDLTGIKENLYENKLKVYPNPTDKNLTFEYNSEKTEKFLINLYNSQGQKLETIVGQSKIGDNKFTLDISKNSSGHPD